MKEIFYDVGQKLRCRIRSRGMGLVEESDAQIIQEASVLTARMNALLRGLRVINTEAMGVTLLIAQNRARLQTDLVDLESQREGTHNESAESIGTGVV